MASNYSPKRIAIQAPLGFSSGLPLLLTGGTLSAWLASENVAIETIGLFAFVALPYNLKFLWAPIFDRYQLSRWGHRRAWIFTFQLLLCITIFGLGLIDVVSARFLLAIMTLLIAFLSASQDIVIDAYRTDVLHSSERGRGTATYVAGYRIAMTVAGAGALMLADIIDWTYTYWVLSGLLGLGVIATGFAPRLAVPPNTKRPPLRNSLVAPLCDLFARRHSVLIVAIVALFKLGDSLAGHLISPFLIHLEFSLTEIGLVQKGLGMIATIIGCAIGGILSDRIGVLRGLLLFGILQAIANIGYWGLSISGKSHIGLAVAIGVDNLCNGLGTAAFVAYLMSVCNRRFSATQYAILTSASSILGRLLSPFAATFVTHWGWGSFFGATIAIAFPALVLVKILLHSNSARTMNSARGLSR